MPRGRYSSSGSAYRVKGPKSMDLNVGLQSNFIEIPITDSSVMSQGVAGFPIVDRHRKRHDMTIENIEYIKDVSGFLNYTEDSVIVSPGNFNCFPSLSGLSDNFEEYTVDYIEFLYKPLTTELMTAGSPQSINNSLGTVMLGFVENPNPTSIKSYQNFQFANKNEFLSVQESISVKSTSLCHIKIHPKYFANKRFYLRQGESLSVSQPYTDLTYANIFTLNNSNLGVLDTKLTDVGRIIVASQGYGANDGNSWNNVIGELYIKYKIRLLKSRPAAPFGYGCKMSHYKISGKIDNSHWFGTVQQEQPGSTIQLSFFNTVDTLNNTYNAFQMLDSTLYGDYMIILSINGSNSSWTFPPFQYDNNLGPNNLWDIESQTGTAVSGTSTNAVYISTYTLNNNSSVVPNIPLYWALQTGQGTMITSPVAYDFWIVQLNSNINT